MCKLKVRYGEIEFEAEGTPEFIEAERTVFQNNLSEAMALMSVNRYTNSKILEPETILPSSSPVLIESVVCEAKKYTSLSQYLRTKNFCYDTDKVLGVACYLYQNENKETFSANCIETALKDARQNIPTNINACINQGISAGRIVEDKENKIDGKKSYYITDDGITYCNDYVAKETKTTKIAKKSKIKSTALSPVCSINVDSLNVDKYCDITKLEKLNDQIRVLMLMFSKETEFQELTQREIEYILTTRFKIPATKRQIAYYFEKAGQEVHSTPVNNGKGYKYSLMKDGIKEAERAVQSLQD